MQEIIPHKPKLKELEKAFRLAYGRRRGRKLLLEKLFDAVEWWAIDQIYYTTKETIKKGNN